MGAMKLAAQIAFVLAFAAIAFWYDIAYLGG